MWAAVAVGTVLRLAIPYKLVMVFSAYRLAEDAAAFVHVPRSGAAPLVLYRMAFAAWAPDHLTMVALHTACGLALLVLLPALVARGSPPPGTAAVVAWAVGLTPVFALDGRTENPIVPGLLWLGTGALLWDAGLASARRFWLVGAVVLLALAAQSRPELVAVAPAAAVALAWRHRAQPGWRVRVAGAAVAWLALVAPHLLHLRHAIALEQAAGSVPALGPGYWLQVPVRLAGSALPLLPALFPVVTTLLAVAGLFAAKTRNTVAALLAIAALWMALTTVDLPRTSVPRLHAGAALLVTVAAARALCGWWQRMAPARPRVWAFGLAAVWLGSALPGASALLARTNEDDAEQFLREAVAALPATGACVVALDMGDEPPAHRTQRAFPAYLLRPPHRDAKLYSVEGWRRADQPLCPAGTYFVVDHRCFAMHADGRAAGITPSPMVDGCARLLREHPWSPVLARSVPNRGDNEYGYYGATRQFRLALYRLARR
ncbi:MAG: hypothetical protein FJ100_12090 [Deltaproteobacteria bacterium]|nr:hypothetical protein [Deltaproteobacteria bacterium]